MSQLYAIVPNFFRWKCSKERNVFGSTQGDASKGCESEMEQKGEDGVKCLRSSGCTKIELVQAFQYVVNVQTG
jgi:hypothetical protein